MRSHPSTPEISTGKCFTLGAKHRKIFSENMLLHARINTGITFPLYFSKHNQTAENILHIAKHNLKKKTSSAGLVMVLMDHKQICRSKAF